MEQGGAQSNEDREDPDPWILSEDTVTHEASSTGSTWTNGQCILAVPASSILAPRFDLSLCRMLLENKGFQIPVEDFETPLRTALDPPSIRRYLFFNSSLFHFIMAPILYVVLWCAVFSTLHRFLKDRMDLWVLCLSVTFITILVTTSIILIFHYNNKEININIDVRLVAVNERLVTHGLLLGLADWIEKCTGKMQLCCVYWNLEPCLQMLTEVLTELDLVRAEVQRKVKKRMSHLIVTAEVTSPESDAEWHSEEPNEEHPLLEEGRQRPTSLRKRQEDILTESYTLIPDFTLSHQAIAYQLLMTYSAVYVKLLKSERLPDSSCCPLGSQRKHCSAAPLCLCQYVQYKLLQ